MKETNDSKLCPKCGSHRFKPWRDLTDEEKFLAERLPMSADHSRKAREKHRFCTRCWFESPDSGSHLA